MTLEEAIKILERHYVLYFDVPRAKLIEASNLSIEALKAIKAQRTAYDFYSKDLLPGETEE